MGLMTEYPDRRVWRLGGHEVTRLIFDYQFAVQIWWRDESRGDSDVTVTIGVPFTIRVANREQRVDPEDTATISPALHVLHKAVETLSAFRSGRLLLRFAGGVEIAVEKHPDYEAWEASGTGLLSDVRLLCSAHEGPPWRE
jgi:hypothetical protein